MVPGNKFLHTGKNSSEGMNGFLLPIYSFQHEFQPHWNDVYSCRAAAEIHMLKVRSE